MSFRNVSGPAELIGRALEEQGGGKVVVVALPEPGLANLWSETLPGARYVYLDYAVYRKDRELLRRMSDSAEELVFFGEGDTGGGFDVGALFAPKEKELTEYLLGWMSGRVTGRVLVAGENKAGIRSVKPMLEETVGPVVGHRSGRHSVLWEAERSRTAGPPRPLRREFEVSVAGAAFRAISYPGVFSHGEMDPGTKFLLETLDKPRFRRALDWGCGSGVIGTALQFWRRGSSVSLVDSNAMALQSARETLVLNGFAPGGVTASDVFSDVRGTFDLILSNPPFHAGVKTELSVTERMIRESGRFLVPGGRLVLVANAFLRYPSVLRESFSDVNLLAENPSYRVFEAKNG